MQIFDKLFVQRLFGVFDYFINTTEAGNGFDEIVNANTLLSQADSVCFKKIPRLVVSEAAAAI